MRTRGVIHLFGGAWLVVNVAGCGSNDHSTSRGGGASGGNATSNGGTASGGAPTGGTVSTGGGASNGGSANAGGAPMGGTASGGAAGSSATGGTTSSGSEGGVAVQPCDALPAAGTWHNISPTAFTNPSNMEALAVVVNPKDGTVYAAAGNKTNGGDGGTGVLKSTDCGATWTLVSSGTNGDKLQSGDPWAMLIDPQEPENLYINNGYGTDPTIFKSTNGGVDWAELNPDPDHVTAMGAPFVQSIAIDPFDDTHLAVTFHANCAAPYNPWCFSQSSDGGATWKTFNGPTSVPGFTIDGWMESASISILGPTSYLALSPGGVYFTADAGSTWTLVLAEIDYASYAGSTHLLPDGTLYIGNSAGPLYTSTAAPMHAPPFALYQAPTLPVPMPRLPYETGLSPAVTPLANSPQVTEVVDDGVNLFAGNVSGQNPSFYTAPLSDPTKWTQMPDKICVQDVCRGPNEMAADPIHHVVYSANWGAGLWRLVTH